MFDFFVKTPHLKALAKTYIDKKRLFDFDKILNTRLTCSNF